jgi:hypothetical protein
MAILSHSADEVSFLRIMSFLADFKENNNFSNSFKRESFRPKTCSIEAFDC